MTKEEIKAFINGDCLVRYDGQLYYFDTITTDGILIMRDINNDYAHGVMSWGVLKTRRYTKVAFR